MLPVARGTYGAEGGLVLVNLARDRARVRVRAPLGGEGASVGTRRITITIMSTSMRESTGMSAKGGDGWGGGSLAWKGVTHRCRQLA